MKAFTGKFNNYIKRHKLTALREVLIFCLITIIVHYSYRYWANVLDYSPIKGIVISISDFLAQQVISTSTWFLTNVLGIDVQIINERLYFANSGWVGVSMGCSAFKQLLQFLILILVYPGPWKAKLWFIPVGFIAIQTVNNIRIITLSLITNYNGSQGFWDFTHDYVLRPLFYVVIFTMWVIWVEIISKRTRERK